MATVAEIFKTMEYGPAPESDKEVLGWLAKHERVFGHFVDGAWTDPGRTFDVINPATSKTIARVTDGTKADVDVAVTAARRALPAWKGLSPHARARYLYALARAVQKHSRLLAVLESMDNGKSIRETRDIDIPLVARHFYHHAGWAQLLDSEFDGYEAIGVVGQIIPWNFPLLMLAWKIAPALAAGNTVVLKPAEFTPLTALCFAEIADAAGIPPGVINIVTGHGETGAAIVEHPDVDKIAFTGSTEVGKIIRRATAGSGKKLSLELGGKSPFIVYDDADLDSVVEGVVDAIWFNQGQVCCAGSRLLVQESVAEKMIAKLRARMEKLRVGDPLDKAVDIGAIVGPAQLETIERLVRTGVAEGARMWQPSWACPTEGCFYPPTLFTEVAPAATIAQTEIFGPVLVTLTFRTPAEAVALANNTAYGLAASVWSESVNQALDVARKLKAGTVWINSTNVFDASSGFGGYRESGFGREGGLEGLYEYLTPKWQTHKPHEGYETADAGETAAHPNGSGVRGRRQRAAQSTRTAANGHGNGAHIQPDGHDPAANPLLWSPIDRTPKQFIGGKQVRPDSGYSRGVYAPDGELLGEVGEGNRKDIRNAVEAARAAAGWADATAYNRAQILYYIAENLSTRADEFAGRIAAMTGRPPADTQAEVERSIERLFTYAAWADKYDGAIHSPPLRGMTLAVHEPVGALGLVCPDEYPLLGFISLVAPAIAMGNTVVAVPSERHPLAATDFYSVLETSDVPAGVVNIVTGPRDTLADVLARHDDVDGVWYFGSADGARMVEEASAGNMKRTWCGYGRPRAWMEAEQGEGREFLRAATQVKNIWVPMGE
ncbi:MAG TPA: aldehyde dehydrogenase family protein [Pseudolabrys sp.]|nr:aldehyde dehydrogenase family protein [Pseudolabrys sp.]